MTAYEYHFVSHWKVRGTPERIFEILKDGPRYSEWWRPAYVQTKKVSDKKVESLVRARLPYTLRFTTELVREQKPREIEIRAQGELAGTGLWTIKKNGDFTEIQFFWEVRAEKPLVRWLSFILKPLFRWNHDWVMNTGEKCLQREIDRKHPH